MEKIMDSSLYISDDLHSSEAVLQKINDYIHAYYIIRNILIMITIRIVVHFLSSLSIFCF